MKYRFRVVEYYPPQISVPPKEETIESNSIDNIFKISFMKVWESSSNQYNGFEQWVFDESSNPIKIFATTKDNRRFQDATVYCERIK